MGGVRVNWIAILVLVIVHQVIGAAWYGAFQEPWLASLGKTREEVQGGNPLIYLLPVIFAATSSYLLTRILDLTGRWTAIQGLQWALFLWVLLVLPYDIQHNAFAGLPFSLTLIDAGKDLVALAVSGLVLGVWRPKAAAAAVKAA